MKKITLLVTLIASMLSLNVSAKDIKVGTGGAKGNYFSMLNDIKSYCEEDYLAGDTLNVMTSEGSVDNLLGMSNKVYSVGVVQEDVLQYHKKRSPRKVNGNRIKVISGLHEEVVHLLIPKGYQPESDKKKGWFDSLMNEDKKQPKIELSMLKNQTVGSWGGSMVSAQALSFFFDLNLNVVEIPAAKRTNVKIPMIIVGGYPYKPVQEYLKTGKYHLVSLNYEKISATAGFYSKQMANYKINGKVTGINTIGVRALLVGKSFRKSSRNVAMSAIATCINDNIADLADDPDTNPLWSSVFDLTENEGQVDWKYFPLQEDDGE